MKNEFLLTHTIDQVRPLFPLVGKGQNTRPSSTSVSETNCRVAEHVISVPEQSRGAIIPSLETLESRVQQLQALRYTCQTSPIAMWAYDKETKRILYVNAAAVSRYGYSEEEMLEMTIFDLRSSGEKLRLSHYLESAPLKKDGSAGYWLHQTKSGRLVWVEILYQEIILGNQEARLISAPDVTGRIKSWDAHDEAMSDAFFATDAEWRFTALNRKAEILLSRKAEEVIGTNLWQDFPPVLGTEFHSKYQEALRSGKPVQFEEYYKPLSTWFEVNAYPRPSVRSVDGSVVSTTPEKQWSGVSIFFHDITARKEAQIERERLLRQQAEVALQQRHFLKEVLFSVTEGRLRLCDSAEELPCVDSGAREEVIALTTSADLTHVRQSARQMAETCGFSMEQNYNLITAVNEVAMNALQHGDCLERAAEVTIWATSDKSEVNIRVKDYGKGIAWEQIPRATLLRGHSTGGTLGHGFYLTLQAADQVYLLTGTTGTTVAVRQFKDRPKLDWLTLP